MRNFINTFRAAFGLEDLPEKDETRRKWGRPWPDLQRSSTETEGDRMLADLKELRKSRKKRSATVIINGEDVTDRYVDADGNVNIDNEFSKMLKPFADILVDTRDVVDKLTSKDHARTSRKRRPSFDKRRK